MTHQPNICSHCDREIPYDPQTSKMVRHVRNQYGIYHDECWPVHKREMR